MTRIAAYIPNLMDRSRFASHVEMLPTLDDLKSANADLILIDASKPEVLEYLPAGPRVIAFAPHVNEQILDLAKAAGCADALPRSIFFKRLPQLLGDSDG
ncbi:MAG: hypothetical protein ACPHL4_05070 [Acidimicrobiales bacterium]|jgi:hypothetical protein|nr:hypothetical protein [Acidimicrobiaceae bacterium]MEC7427237.1 hypothetical protein [Actinomycetota bacterium]MEC9089478.1 hypothetical protein [Actinomycetota bacterium]MEE2680077.1 hypothetical protein [Actinomycetota bacterium]HAQ42359.1 hypothetical protein [Acidimicrobiaceae bacterium]